MMIKEGEDFFFSCMCVHTNTHRYNQEGMYNMCVMQLEVLLLLLLHIYRHGLYTGGVVWSRR